MEKECSDEIKAYSVVVDTEGCEYCGANIMFGILGPDGNMIGY